jgi:hypothetical protein
MCGSFKHKALWSFGEEGNRSGNIFNAPNMKISVLKDNAIDSISAKALGKVLF